MLEADGLVEIGQREEILPAVPQRHAAAVIGMRELCVEEERAGEILDGARILVELLIGQAAIIESQRAKLGRHGIDPHGRGIVVDGTSVFVEPLEGKTAVEQCIGQDFRLQSAGLDRLAVSRCRRHGVAGLERLVGVRNQLGILWGCGEGRAGDRRACSKKRGTNRRKND